MPIETELKLRFLTPEDAAKLAEHPLLADTAPPTQQHLIGTYYDTPAAELLRSGVGLRVRREHGRLIQAVKTAGTASGGLHQRQEWEVEVKEGTVPDFSQLPKALRKEKFSDKKLLKRIEACFSTDFKRTQWILPLTDGGQVEVCLDQGEIRNDERSVPLHEVELELKNSNNPARLYEIALQLQQVMPLVVENASKAQRGYELATPATPVPQKALPSTLTPVMSAEDAFIAIMNDCFQQIQGNEAAARQGTDPEGVHQMRVGLRRMRACLTLFRPLIPRNSWQPLRDELRRLTEILGHARDWDVFAETLDDIAARTGEAAVLKSLRGETDKIRLQYYHELRTMLDTVRYSRLLLTLGAWLSSRRWQANLNPAMREALAQPVVPFATETLRKQHKRTCKRGKGLVLLPPAERHQVRIEAKKLAYGARFFRELYPHNKALADAYIDSLSVLRDELGALNDAATARTLLDEAGLSPDAGARRFLQGWYGAEAVHKLQAAGRGWENFLQQKRFW